MPFPRVNVDGRCLVEQGKHGKKRFVVHPGGKLPQAADSPGPRKRTDVGGVPRRAEELGGKAPSLEKDDLEITGPFPRRCSVPDVYLRFYTDVDGVEENRDA